MKLLRANLCGSVKDILEAKTAVLTMISLFIGPMIYLLSGIFLLLRGNSGENSAINRYVNNLKRQQTKIQCQENAGHLFLST